MKRRFASRPSTRGRLFSLDLANRAEEFYHLSEDGRSITCRVCGLTSRDPKNIREKYCPACRIFHEDRIVMARIAEGYDTGFKWYAPTLRWKPAA